MPVENLGVQVLHMAPGGTIVLISAILLLLTGMNKNQKFAPDDIDQPNH